MRGEKKRERERGGKKRKQSDTLIAAITGPGGGPGWVRFGQV